MCPSYAVVSPTPATTTGRSPLCLTLRRVNDQQHPRCNSSDCNDNISPHGTQQCSLKRSSIIMNTCRYRVKPYIRLPPPPLSFHPEPVITADLVTTSDPVTETNPVTFSVPVTNSESVTTAAVPVTADHKSSHTPSTLTSSSETLQLDDSVVQTDKTELPRTKKQVECNVMTPIINNKSPVRNHKCLTEIPRFVGHQINDKLLQNLLYSTSSLHHGAQCEELKDTISKYHELTDQLNKLNIAKSVLVKEIQTIDTLKERLETYASPKALSADETDCVAWQRSAAAVIKDAIFGNYQEKLMKKYPWYTNADITFYSYSFGTFLILTWLISTGQLLPSISFSREHNQVYPMAMLYSTLGYLGLQCVLGLIKSSGVLVCTIVTTMRKVLTLVLSFIFFAKPFCFQYVWSGGLVILGIGINVYTRNKPAIHMSMAAGSRSFKRFFDSHYTPISDSERTIQQALSADETDCVAWQRSAAAVIKDAIFGNYQEKLMKKYPWYTNADITFYSYSFGTFLILTWLISTGQLLPSISFSREHNQVYPMAMLYSTLGYLGLQCVLGLIKSSGVLVCTIVTTMRKVLTLVLSFIFFAKPFCFQYVWSGGLVILGIGINVYTRNKPAIHMSMAAGSRSFKRFFDSHYTPISDSETYSKKLIYLLKIIKFLHPKARNMVIGQS
eukprot:sb/3462742/